LRLLWLDLGRLMMMAQHLVLSDQRVLMSAWIAEEKDK
jgi:hypothetical protein